MGPRAPVSTERVAIIVATTLLLGGAHLLAAQSPGPDQTQVVISSSAEEPAPAEADEPDAGISSAMPRVALSLVVHLPSGSDRGEGAVYVVPEGRQLVIESVSVVGTSPDAAAPIESAMLTFPGSELPPVAPVLTTSESAQMVGKVKGIATTVPSGTQVRVEATRRPSLASGEVMVTVRGHFEE